MGQIIFFGVNIAKKIACFEGIVMEQEMNESTSSNNKKLFSSRPEDWSIDEALKLYNIQRWGDGYFDINEKGNIVVLPEKNANGPQIDLMDIVEEMKIQGIAFPAVIRFHDILRSQVKSLNKAFRDVIDECRYEGRYMGVYPVKVNQMREVVEEIIDVGAAYDYGLEAGSKAELLSVLALNTNKDSLTILNGYKDEDFFRLAMSGLKLDRKIIVVIEKFSELKTLIKISREMNMKPIIGLRTKMSVKGRGKWSESSGDKAKFGLSISEILNAISLLKSEGLDDCIKLLHFHIGSQITDIRTVKDAITEAARLYSKIVKMGINLEYFDVGGGLGVDYDGSQSTNESSKNYTLAEYATDVVYGLKQICDLEAVHHPNIVTESGRAVTAHHSCVVTNVIDMIQTTHTDFDTRKVTGEHHLVSDIRNLEQDLNKHNFQQIYSEAQQLKDDCQNAFRLGILGLEERAKIETIYWTISKSIVAILKDVDFVPEGLQDLEDQLAPQYLCNFSIFQSAADSWAIDQILPAMPLTRLNEFPEYQCSICDITCDSDGKIDSFVDGDGIKKTVPLHGLIPGKDYYIGLFLTGAYQDVMGDMHNLFGRLNEVHVFSDDDDPTDFYIEEVIKGSSASEVLRAMQYNPEYMAHGLKKVVDKQVQRGRITPRDGVKLVDFYESCLQSYTYLNHSKNFH